MRFKDIAADRYGAAAMVFAYSFAVRLILNLAFMARFGSHAVNHVEAWHYRGLMSGTTRVQLQYGDRDITLAILKAVGSVLPQDLHLFAVNALSIIFISLVAAFICLIAGRLYGIRAGLAAGLVYGSMVQPLALSIAGFTHDHVQLPLMVACIYFAVRAARSSLVQGAFWTFAFVLTFEAGRYVNDSIKVGLGIAAVYAGLMLWTRGLSLADKWLKRIGDPKAIAWASYVLVMILALAALSMTVIPNVLGSTLEKLPQGRMGSADVMPTSLSTVFMRYNVLLFLLPFALAYAGKKRDVIGISAAILGIAFAIQMDRGTRILDIGVAIMAGIALDALPKRMGLPCTSALRRLGCSRFPDHLMTWRVLGISTAIGFPLLAWLTYNALQYEVVILLGSLGLIWAVRLDGDRRLWASLMVIALTGAAVNVAYIATVQGRKIVSDTEYRVWDWLAENNEGGVVLAGWDRGFMAEAITGLEPVSSPSYIQRDIHGMLWMPERQAAASLSAANVSYVMVTSQNFNLVRGDDGAVFYRLVGGLLFHEDYAPDPKAADRYAVYKLRHGIAGEHFRLLVQENDTAADMQYYLYEVMGPKDPATSYIGGIAYNTGKEREVDVFAAGYTLSEGVFERHYTLLGSEGFGHRQVLEVSYPIVGNLTGCHMRAETGELTDSYSGALTFLGTGGGKLKLKLALVPDGEDEPASVFEREFDIDDGAKKTIEYRFDDVPPFTEYGLRMDRLEGAHLLQGESYGPDKEGVRFLEVFC